MKKTVNHELGGNINGFLLYFLYGNDIEVGTNNS